MYILPFYAALLVLLFVVLSIRTLRLRRSLKIGVGDGGNPQMLRAMRVHSNFAEYDPLALLMVYLVEGRGAYPVFVHALALAQDWLIQTQTEGERRRVSVTCPSARRPCALVHPTTRASAHRLLSR